MSSFQLILMFRYSTYERRGKHVPRTRHTNIRDHPLYWNVCPVTIPPTQANQLTRACIDLHDALDPLQGMNIKAGHACHA